MSGIDIYIFREYQKLLFYAAYQIGHTASGKIRASD